MCETNALKKANIWNAKQFKIFMWSDTEVMLGDYEGRNYKLTRKEFEDNYIVL